MQSAQVATVARTTCAQVMANTGVSGVYQLSLPESGLPPFYAFCERDPTNGAPWTVLMRRQNRTFAFTQQLNSMQVNFNRTWEEYRVGFGNVMYEHWLGLEYMHALTAATNRPQQLWIRIQSTQTNIIRNVYYESFVVGGWETNYAIRILGPFRGDTADNLRYNEGMQFATYDRDTSAVGGNGCVRQHGSGWWYTNCFVG